MREQYTPEEFNMILSRILPRKGWDFSSMKTQSTPEWDYIKIVQEYLEMQFTVLDIGTGGGEKFSSLASHFKSGLGVDIDPAMIDIANDQPDKPDNISFAVSGTDLESVEGIFDVILNRHAPFNLGAIKDHLAEDGYFITQQVGERNMQNIKEVLNQSKNNPPITVGMIEGAGLQLIDFREYNIEYLVEDIESLVFWLKALDMLHSDIDSSGLNVGLLNRILKGNITSKGFFITNEHRYLAISKK